MEIEVIKTIMIGITIVVGSIFPSKAIGKIGLQALESIGRNPEAESGIRTTMILAIAFAEAVAIYALVVSLIIKFV